MLLRVQTSIAHLPKDMLSGKNTSRVNQLNSKTKTTLSILAGNSTGIRTVASSASHSQYPIQNQKAGSWPMRWASASSCIHTESLTFRLPHRHGQDLHDGFTFTPKSRRRRHRIIIAAPLLNR